MSDRPRARFGAAPAQSIHPACRCVASKLHSAGCTGAARHPGDSLHRHRGRGVVKGERDGVVVLEHARAQHLPVLRHLRSRRVGAVGGIVSGGGAWVRRWAVQGWGQGWRRESAAGVHAAQASAHGRPARLRARPRPKLALPRAARLQGSACGRRTGRSVGEGAGRSPRRPGTRPSAGLPCVSCRSGGIGEIREIGDMGEIGGGLDK